jgi:hypothetical protein
MKWNDIIKDRMSQETSIWNCGIYLAKYRVFNLKVDRILMSNLFTKIYNMLHYATNLYLQ